MEVNRENVSFQKNVRVTGTALALLAKAAFARRMSTNGSISPRAKAR